MAASTDADSLDRAFDIISDPTRRCLLRYLRARPQRTVPVDEVCQALAREQSDRDGPPRDADQLAVACHHVHLPKLAAANVIEYDRAARTVQYRADPLVERLLGASPDGSR